MGIGCVCGVRGVGSHMTTGGGVSIQPGGSWCTPEPCFRPSLQTHSEDTVLRVTWLWRSLGCSEGERCDKWAEPVSAQGTG